MNSVVSSRPRVIFVTSVFDDVVNGPGTYARYLWDSFLADDDLDFHVVAPRGGTRHPNVHSVEAAGRNIMWEIQRRALQIAGEQPRDCLVHGNSAYMMFLFCGFPGPWLAQINDYEAATVWAAPTSVVRARGLRRFVSLAWRHRQESKAIGAAQRIVCNSEYLRDTLQDAYGIQDTARLNVVYKAVDTKAFARSDPLPADPLATRPLGARLLFIGDDWRRKGVPELLEALPGVAKRLPNCHLTIAGPGVGQHAQVQRIAHRHGVVDRIHLAGRVSREELPALLWHSDLFVLPAHAEALGVSILEALAAGVPVVASRVGGIPEIIRSPGEGLLTPPARPTELTSTICKALEDDNIRTAARIAGPKRAADFAVEKMIARLKQIYFELLDGTR